MEKEKYKSFTRPNGKVERLNKFSFELLRDKDFRKQMRMSVFRGLFGRLTWTDDRLLKNIDEILRNISAYKETPNGYALTLRGFYGYRVSSSSEEEKRQNYIVYSRSGHPNVREKAATLYLKSLRASGLKLPEKVANRVAELFAIEWKTYVQENSYTLHIDEEFESIYSSSSCKGNFHSCMTDKGFWEFYQKQVCKAAYLTDGTGKIVARAILWYAHDEGGNRYKYLDRQYSTGARNELQQLLVNACRDADAIDLFKPVGTSCGDAANICTVSGDAFNESLCVDIDFEECRVPYMDTFKYLNADTGIASCSEDSEYTHILQNTDGRFIDDALVYSEHYGEDINEDVAVFVEDVQDWYREDDEDICYCDDRRAYRLREGAYYAQDTGLWYATPYDLYYAEDTGEYYEFSDSLYHAEDTDAYFAERESLCYCLSDGLYYSEGSEDIIWSNMHHGFLLKTDAVFLKDVEDYTFERGGDYVVVDGEYYSKQVAV